jgi:CBS domain-containing protein
MEITMFVEERMTKDVKTCQPHDSLAATARVLWGNDCACAPVVNGEGRVLGMVTDRDICMAACSTGLRLAEILVVDVMAREVVTTRARSTLLEAELLMRARGVRRLPVLDDEQHLVGLLSSSDICRAIDAESGQNASPGHAEHFVATLAMLGRRRASGMAGRGLIPDWPVGPRQPPNDADSPVTANGTEHDTTLVRDFE